MTDMAFELVDVRLRPLAERDAERRQSTGRWNPRTRAVVWLTLAFWLSNLAILTTGNLLARNEQWMQLFAVRAALIGLGLLFCYAMHLALEKLGGRSFKRKIIAAAILAPILAETFAWATYFGFAAMDPGRLSQPIDWGAAMFILGFWTWFFLAWAGLYLAVQYSFDVKEEQHRSFELQALAHTAKLRALHNQVNPHFLFNSLNSIAALIADKRTVEADRMVAKLGNFFRMTLAIDPTEDISLAEELKLQRAYLDIQQLRYPDLEITVDLPDAVATAAVPALILQPIVENAVKYGVAGSLPPSTINIRASTSSDRLRLEVTDSGRPSAASAPPGAGVGLRNVQDRLFQRFGNQQHFSAGREPSGGFTVSIEMPLEFIA
jgi:two-component system LytT family sensor kinase